MRILHIAPSYLPATRYGGPVYSVHGLAKGLVQNGHDVHVMTTNLDGPGVSEVPLGHPVDIDGVKVTYFPAANPRRLYRSVPMGRALRGRMSDFALVHLHSVFLWPTTAGARIAKRVRVPYVLSPRGMLVKELIRRRSRFLKQAWIALSGRRTIRDAAALHVTSDIEAADLEPFGFDLPTIINLPNGVDIPSVTARNEPAGDVADAIADWPYVLAFGRITWKKNLATLVAALAHLPPPARLVIAGTPEDGHDRNLAALASSMGIADRVSIIARDVQGVDKDALYRGCHVFALASMSENFGNVILEAMSFGKPVVASSRAGASTLVASAGCGIVAPPTESGFADSLGQLLCNPREAGAMGARGRAAAERKFSWSSVASAMAQHYDALLRT